MNLVEKVVLHYYLTKIVQSYFVLRKRRPFQILQFFYKDNLIPVESNKKIFEEYTEEECEEYERNNNVVMVLSSLDKVRNVINNKIFLISFF